MAATDKHGDGEAGWVQGEGSWKEKRAKGRELVPQKHLLAYVRPERFAL
jgi:hypothetical protein